MREHQDPTPSEYTDRRRAERRLDRRVLPAALLISAALHLMVFRIAVLPPPDRLPAPPPRAIEIERVMRAYDITAVTTEVPSIDVQVQERELRRELLAPEAPWIVPPAAAPPPADNVASVRDRLRYRMGSVEVWRPHTDPHGDIMTPDQVVEARIAAELKSFNDSLAAAEASRAVDWTVTDRNGDRWGIGEGGIIHLGKVTIPVPVQFSVPPGRRDELNARARSWTEIQLQAARIETEDIVQERIRLIRERLDRERAANGGGQSGNGSGGSNSSSGNSSGGNPPGGTTSGTDPSDG
jgi:uncharacterized membrane protein YgcG